MDDLIEKRLKELYYRAENHAYCTYSDFLNINEQSRLAALKLRCITYGGYDMAQRIIAGFGENTDTDSFPITLIKVSPVSQKFADKLSHRDFLGAIMTLGIKREAIGDIIIKENSGYIFCLDKIAGYLCDSLTRIKHTSVNAVICEALPSGAVEEPEPKSYVVSSCRADVLICAVYKLSRNEAAALFAGDKVFVNSAQLNSSSYIAKDSDIFSVRGHGRFVFAGVEKKTKKDRFAVSIIKYT